MAPREDRRTNKGRREKAQEKKQKLEDCEWAYVRYDVAPKDLEYNPLTFLRKSEEVYIYQESKSGGPAEAGGGGHPEATPSEHADAEATAARSSTKKS